MTLDVRNAARGLGGLVPWKIAHPVLGVGTRLHWRNLNRPRRKMRIAREDLLKMQPRKTFE
jgi:hypothetical protein